MEDEALMENYVGEIRMFAGNYAPDGWHLCDGSKLPVSQYQSLFALLGTTYGGDGQTTFGIPDLRGRLPIGQGQGSGLTNRVIGQIDGSETVAITNVSQIPAHTHTVNASNTAGSQPNPQNGVWAGLSAAKQYIASSEIKSPSITKPMNSAAIGNSTGGAAHDNMMPYFPLNFIIALQGNWPVRP